ncbi:Uncharacterised protein [Shimwellia blattae]|nr:Uncharacterised protein [Shimwellia blattae]
MTRRTTPPGIQVRDLSLRFGDNTLFSGLNFTIEGAVLSRCSG